MKSLKAIFIGSLFIITTILILQLAFIFIAVAYNALAKDFPLLADISVSFRYLVGIPVFITVMFFGGMITATILNSSLVDDPPVKTVEVSRLSNFQAAFHSAVVGFICAGGMLFSAMDNASLTLTGIIVFVLALLSTTAGGLYTRRNLFV